MTEVRHDINCTLSFIGFWIIHPSDSGDRNPECEYFLHSKDYKKQEELHVLLPHLISTQTRFTNMYNHNDFQRFHLGTSVNLIQCNRHLVSI